ncbi:MAG: hypothetical protein [Microvirus sp.]|nr:MAG: hypothetical protein [Microvirus sp.]
MKKTSTMKKPTIRSRYNFELKGNEGEFYTGKSLTINDDTMSIRELLERYTRGQELPIRPGTYGDDENEEDDMEGLDLEKFGRADINEKFRIHKDQVERVNQAKKAIKERKEHLEGVEATKKALNDSKKAEN